MTHTSSDTSERMNSEFLKSALKSQYLSALAMLREAIEKCPSILWEDASYLNQFWHIACHALFYTHLYLQTDEHVFQPWDQHRKDYNFLDGSPCIPPDSDETKATYSRDQILQYLEFCEKNVADWVDCLDLTSPESGFHWYNLSKLEHQFVNLRHIQHHAGQLADRVRVVGDVGVDWVGKQSNE